MTGLSGLGLTKGRLGVDRGGRGHSFFFEILYYFLWNSQKNKRYLYSWQVAKCPGHPFLSFLDAPLLTVAKLTFPQPVPE